MTQPENESLQLDRAEPLAAPETTATAVVCAGCGRTVDDAYFTVGPKSVCASCRDAVVHQLSARTGESFGRALLWGVGGAALGSVIYFAVSKITGYEIGLVGIVAGFLVGHGVRRGSRARGGRRYQVLAGVLTYLAIVTTYVPLIVHEIRESARSKPAASGSTSQAASPLAPGAATIAPALVAPAEPPPSLGRALVGLGFAVVIVFGLAILAPILAGPSNFMGWVILAFSVWEAWKLNRHVEVPIRGPFRVGAPPA